jgi:Asp-tRNA(Asn)/Glu-tRNA(Gln) amidotransferase A subunit family amidase
MGALEEAYIKAASSAAEAPQGPAASTSEQGAADASAEVTASVSQKSETAGAGAPPQEGGEEEDTGKDVVKSGQHEDQSAVEVARPPAASEEQQQQESEQATSQAEPPRVLPPPPSPNQLAAARDLSRRVLEVLRDTVKPDTIMVLPALPFPPPKRGAAQVEMSVFVKLTRAFNVLATLGSCPTVTVPVGQLRDGSPVAISLLAVHK